MSVVSIILFVGGLIKIVLNRSDLIRVLIGVEISLCGLCNEFVLV